MLSRGRGRWAKQQNKDGSCQFFSFFHAKDLFCQPRFFGGSHPNFLIFLSSRSIPIEALFLKQMSGVADTISRGCDESLCRTFSEHVLVQMQALKTDVSKTGHGSYKNEIKLQKFLRTNGSQHLFLQCIVDSGKLKKLFFSGIF